MRNDDGQENEKGGLGKGKKSWKKVRKYDENEGRKIREMKKGSKTKARRTMKRPGKDRTAAKTKKKGGGKKVEEKSK